MPSYPPPLPPSPLPSTACLLSGIALAIPAHAISPIKIKSTQPRPDLTGKDFLLQSTAADNLGPRAGQPGPGGLTADVLAERFRAAAEGNGAYITPAQFADFYTGLLSSWVRLLI